MDTPHGKIIEETEYSMVYDEDFVVSDTRLIKDSLFCTFSVIVTISDTFLKLKYKSTCGTGNAKKNKKGDVGIKTKDIL
jgi:hypothetical protein